MAYMAIFKKSGRRGLDRKTKRKILKGKEQGIRENDEEDMIGKLTDCRK